jgi:lysozyme
MNTMRLAILLALGAGLYLLASRKSSAAPFYPYTGGEIFPVQGNGNILIPSSEGLPTVFVPTYSQLPDWPEWYETGEPLTLPPSYTENIPAEPGEALNLPFDWYLGMEDYTLPTAENADGNLYAFLAMLRRAEGGDYDILYGGARWNGPLTDHPRALGWKGVRLPDQYCRNAGLNPPCYSTAAGAYQITYPTWKSIRQRLGLPDFSPASQDAAAIELLREIGALPLIQQGKITEAIRVASSQWASLPFSTAGQPKRSLDDVLAYFREAGGTMVA